MHCAPDGRQLDFHVDFASQYGQIDLNSYLSNTNFLLSPLEPQRLPKNRAVEKHNLRQMGGQWILMPVLYHSMAKYI